MEYDFAIIYFGLTRTVKKTYESHINHIYKILDDNHLSYKKFMHTWKTKDNTQNIWEEVLDQKIDYNEYKLLKPDLYTLDCEDEFLESINMNDYFYKDIWNKIGHSSDGEWLPKLVSNYICMLESQKRGFDMVLNNITLGNKFKYILFIRPDITIHNDLPLHQIIFNKINIPNHSHHEGLNDQVAIMNFEHACIYGKRINELAEYRKTIGRIVPEKYLKYIIDKYKIEINEILFDYCITRSDECEQVAREHKRVHQINKSRRQRTVALFGRGLGK